MKNTVLLTLGLFVVSLVGYSQDANNLVPDPSFEDLEGRLRKPGQMEIMQHWKPATGSGADIFEKGHKKVEISIPDNMYGREKPITGKRYAGLVYYSYNNREPRNYMITELANPLKAGANYCIKYNVSLSDLSKYAVNNVGAYVSKKKISKESEASLLFPAQVTHSKNKVIDEQYTWTEICGVFQAKGGEKYLTLGNFASNENTEYKKMKRPKGFNKPQKANAYYYVEDISVVQIIDGDMSECQCEKETEERKKMIYSKQIISDKALSIDDKIEYSTVYFDFLSKDLEGAAHRDLDSLAVLLKANTDIQLEVVGHMDKEEMTKAKETTNSLSKFDKLAENRVNAVINYLKTKGVASARLTAKWVDDQEPADTALNDIAKAKNRRVEFIKK